MEHAATAVAPSVQNERPAARVRTLRGLAGLALLFALVLPPLIWRAAAEADLGPAELRSLMLSQQSWRETLAIAPLVDQFPAGHACLLKVWNKLGKVLGVPAGVLWSRLPGVLAWAAMVTAAWLLGRGLLGAAGGALLAWTLALGGQGALAARTLGGEALAAPALVIGLLALLTLDRLEREPGGRLRTVAPLWLLYAVTGAAAVWTHRLAGPVVGGFFLLWLALGLAPRPRRARWVEGGIWAHLAILLAAAPLAALLPADERTLAGLRQGWLDFSGPWGLSRALALGHATGMRAWLLLPPPRAYWLILAGFLPLLAPVLVFLYRAFLKSSPLDEAGRGARRLALGGMFTAVFSLVLIRLLQNTAAAPAFAWPHYVFPAWGVWGAGLTGLALWAVRGGTNAGRAWLLMLPWLLGNLASQAVEIRHERRLAAETRRELAAPSAPAAGSPLFVLPAELIPYVRATLRDHPLRPLETLPDLEPRFPDATLLKINTSSLLDFDRDVTVAALAGAGALSRPAVKAPLPARPGLEFIRLAGVERESVARLVGSRFRLQEFATTTGTLAVVTAQEFSPADGWSALEVGAQKDSWRWSMADTVKIRLPQPLPPGRYVLHLRGMRLPYPRKTVNFTFRFEFDYRMFEAPVPDGWFELHVPFVLSHRFRRSVLHIQHPTFHLGDFDPQAGDPRRLGFLCLGAWVTLGPG